ncbi:MAG: hypothetical protein NVS3B20_08120 [Polyangiales bacterium]
MKSPIPSDSNEQFEHGKYERCAGKNRNIAGSKPVAKMTRGSRVMVAIGGLVATVAAVACGGGMGPIGYEARAPSPPPRAKTQVAVYDVDCRSPVMNITDCVYNGSTASWRVIGAFHTPLRAPARWSRYRAQVLDLAAARGCPGLAIRRTAPNDSGNDPISAFCVDPTGPDSASGDGSSSRPNEWPQPATATTYGNGQPAAATYAPTPATQPAPVGTTTKLRECNKEEDCPPGVRCLRGTCRNS